MSGPEHRPVNVFLQKGHNVSLLATGSRDRTGTAPATHGSKAAHTSLIRSASVASDNKSASHSTVKVQTSNTSHDTTKLGEWAQLWAVTSRSWLNLALLPLTIAGFIVQYTQQSGPIIFAINFLAILLLGSWLSYATKELGLRKGGLAIAFVVVLGNLIQLIVTIIALIQGQAVLVQTSIAGSVFSNMILLTGIALIAGGHDREEQYFDIRSVDLQLNYMFLVTGVAGISTFYNEGAISNLDKTTVISTMDIQAGSAQISRAASVFLICAHVMFLYWAFSKPVKLFAVESQTSPEVPGRSLRAIAKAIYRTRLRTTHGQRGSAADDASDHAHEEDEKAKISARLSIFILVIFSVLIGFCATFAVNSVDSLTSSAMTKTFTGFILLPVFSYNLDAVFLAREDRLDYAFVITIGGSMQIVALILPPAVLIGWIADKEGMVIVFDGFQMIILLLSCMAMKYVCSTGRTNWFHGVILIVFYTIVATSTWFYHNYNV